MKYLVPALTVLAAAMTARGEVRTEMVKYKLGDTTMIGCMAWDDAVQGRRPGVLVVHEWYGLNDYAKSRARQLAQLGYVALAVDMYGNGVVANDAAEAGKLATALRNDRPLMRARAQAALETLQKNPLCDPRRVAAIGYCFGGGVVLELARSGADIAGVASFHGNLDTPNLDDAKNIRAKVLVLHGADDPHVNAAQVAAFQQEMRNAKVDWQMIFYGGAVHSFTNPASGDDPSRGVAYNAAADRRSWDAMKAFFNEIFKK
ncbi:MAG: dienelactone hydrolase family protein [Candidatus Brocadiia bacterium]